MVNVDRTEAGVSSAHQMENLYLPEATAHFQMRPIGGQFMLQN